MSENSLDNEEFDAIVFGTGLVESIVASHLAAADKKVLHVDRNPFYGGSSACFSLSAFIEWTIEHRDQRQTPLVEIYMGDMSAQPPPTFTLGHANEQLLASASTSAKHPGTAGTINADNIFDRLLSNCSQAPQLDMRSSLVSQLVALLKDDRSYSIELAPKVAHCRGELVDLIIDKGIAEYLQFKGVEHNYLIRNGVAERVPGSKEDVFASDSLSLIEKRKLMKLMTSITDDESHALLLDGCPEEMTFARFLESKFRLNAKLLDSVLYAVARAESKDELTARSGCERVRKYAKSIGRFGRMAYLCAMYGGGSEIAQSFCRLCAVAGGTYILSEEVRSIEKSWRDGADNGYCVQLAHGKVFAKHIILDPCYSPDSEPTTTAISRAMCILDYPVFGDDTTAILSYVDETEGAVVAMLYTTRATLAAPSGQSIVYAWKTGHLADTRSLLLRALTAARGTLARPLFTALFEVRDLRSSASGLSGLYHTAPPDATVDFDDTVDQARQLLSALL